METEKYRKVSQNFTQILSTAVYPTGSLLEKTTVLQTCIKFVEKTRSSCRELLGGMRTVKAFNPTGGSNVECSMQEAS